MIEKIAPGEDVALARDDIAPLLSSPELSSTERVRLMTLVRTVRSSEEPEPAISAGAEAEKAAEARGCAARAAR